MNKKTAIPFLAAGVLGSSILGVNLYSSAASNHAQPKSIEVSGHETNDDNLAELQAKAKLTSDEAKTIALKKVPGTVKDSELEDEDGVVVYSFEIHNAKGEASDVKVNAENGQIVKVEKGDQDGKDNETDGETNDDNLAELQAKAKLTSDEAKTIALKKVPGTVEKSEIEDEDGVVVYGFEIQAKNGEVKDVKVNAQSGKVLKVESDNQENGQEQND